VSLESMILDEILRELGALGRKVDGLIRGHNALVRLIRFEGDKMSAAADAILAEDSKIAPLFDAVKALINALNNGNNTLDQATKDALAQLDGHVNAVTQEVADATAAAAPPAVPTTSDSGPDAGAVGV
jgi:hypothetical protein